MAQGCWPSQRYTCTFSWDGNFSPSKGTTITCHAWTSQWHDSKEHKQMLRMHCAAKIIKEQPQLDIRWQQPLTFFFIPISRVSRRHNNVVKTIECLSGQSSHKNMMTDPHDPLADTKKIYEGGVWLLLIDICTCKYCHSSGWYRELMPTFWHHTSAYYRCSSWWKRSRTHD